MQFLIFVFLPTALIDLSHRPWTLKHLVRLEGGAQGVDKCVAVLAKLDSGRSVPTSTGLANKAVLVELASLAQLGLLVGL